MGMPYPGGIHLDKLAPSGNPDAYALPHPRVEGSAYDFSFSGLKTAVLNLLHNARQKGEEVNRADLAASFQKTVVELLAGNLLRAAADTGRTPLCWPESIRQLGTAPPDGGRLRPAGIPAVRAAAAAVRGQRRHGGAQGYYEYQSGHLAGMDLNACATMPIEGDTVRMQG